MKGILIFLAGSVVGAGIGIFAYKKYVEYANSENTTEEADETSTENEEPADTSADSEVYVSATHEEESETVNDYTACFNRLEKLKEHEQVKSTEKKEVATVNKKRYEIILEDNFRRFDYPCYQLEYHLRDGAISDEFDGIYTEDSIAATIGDTYNEVRHILEDTADNCVYVRDHEAEEDYEIIAVED